jgi:hypothetical protein
MAIVSFALWLVTAMLILYLNKEPRSRPEDPGVVQPGEETTVTRTPNPDGTTSVLTRKTITYSNGSKEVIETTDVEPSA